MLNQHCALENTRCQGPVEMTCAKPSTQSCAATPWRHAAPAGQLLRSDIHTARRRLKGPLALTLACTWRPRACEWCFECRFLLSAIWRYLAWASIGKTVTGGE